ncbi:MAG: DEAD/DEAH box helicase [Oscillospiraceae bacterium]|jgi:superfamily II DNA or RNA helicase|nr:DEAD/DEAH box helicase [Oscillospiraceae bacterium]
MELRPYQTEAWDAILHEWEDGRRRTLLVLPTGTGKTIVFAKVAQDRVRAGERVLVLAHRGELLEQAADKIQTVTGLGCATEKAEQSSLWSPHEITVGSVQTLMQETRLSKFAPDRFGSIIVDEAHHALSESYQRVLEHFAPAKVLGVTATPDRGDKQDLGQYFESLAYEYTLPQAVRDGYLCKIRAEMIPLQLDLDAVGVQAGDFRAADLDCMLEPFLAQIADEMAQRCRGRKTVVFLPLVSTSQRFRDILRSRGFLATEVNGNSPDRAEILADFEAGKYDVLCNSMLLTEGWDCPSVDCIVVLRPTKIRSLYCQMVGRGTRLCDGKDHLLLLDFLWHTNRHALCRPAHLISETDDLADAATALIAQADGSLDIEEAMQQAEHDAVAEREKALAKQLAEMRQRKKKLVDPLQFEMSIQAEDLSDYVPAFGWEMAPPSQKQLEALERRGIFTDDVACAGKASLLLDRLHKRQDDGLTTPKQIRFLEGKGFLHVGLWQFDQASRLIDRIANNRWQVPYGVTPSTFMP